MMRGEYSDPVANAAHASTYDALHDRDHLESAGLCGACHDIVSPPGAAIERTYADWQSVAFADPEGGDTCAQCHMRPERRARAHRAGPERRPRASTTRTTSRPSTWRSPPAFPNAAAELQNVPALPRYDASDRALRDRRHGAIRVIVDNVAAGHSWPSGAAQDRRAVGRGHRVPRAGGRLPERRRARTERRSSPSRATRTCGSFATACSTRTRSRWTCSGRRRPTRPTSCLFR